MIKIPGVASHAEIVDATYVLANTMVDLLPETKTRLGGVIQGAPDQLRLYYCKKDVEVIENQQTAAEK